jgi:hypothetical protein
VTVVTTLVCFLHPHTRLRAQPAPGIPCALDPKRARIFLTKLARIAPRESLTRVFMILRLFEKEQVRADDSCVVPAKAGTTSSVKVMRSSVLKHDPEKVGTGFPKKIMLKQKDGA